ncbi:hypothetical protein HU830_01975 [Lactobacillus sp. DCY120]|uniref:ABC3 transporter permease protein domain-containing protein n=1 Tax=Bombilactobacillus apium TaxID=2675299 RepID=A0A850R0T0_9LACO|nr:hypothetical protein [Bombilactobacillus apium]NVY95960.1 hypothetical protein [Bombilactobacillus apium]
MLGAKIAQDPEVQVEFASFLPPSLQKKALGVLPAADFQRLAEKSKNLILVETKNFAQSKNKIKQILQSSNLKEDPSGQSGQKYYRYRFYQTGLVGFEYLGFFLEIAFLVMLVSCLMFKVLTDCNLNQPGYQILAKIGTSKKLLARTLRQELLLVFAIPAGLGMMHILLGLQIFRGFLLNPYSQIVWPIVIFLSLYGIYCLLTYWLYRKTLLKN